MYCHDYCRLTEFCLFRNRTRSPVKNQLILSKCKIRSLRPAASCPRPKDIDGSSKVSPNISKRINIGFEYLKLENKKSTYFSQFLQFSQIFQFHDFSNFHKFSRVFTNFSDFHNFFNFHKFSQVFINVHKFFRFSYFFDFRKFSQIYKLLQILIIFQKFLDFHRFS